MNQLIMWSPGVTLENIEEQVILRAYSHYRNNKTATANALGISIRTLDSKLEKYDAEQKRRDELSAVERDKARNFLARQRGGAESNAIAPDKGAENVSRPAAGVRLESAPQTSGEQPVSVPQSKEVQKVLPKQSAAGGARGAR